MTLVNMHVCYFFSYFSYKNVFSHLIDTLLYILIVMTKSCKLFKLYDFANCICMKILQLSSGCIFLMCVIFDGQ